MGFSFRMCKTGKDDDPPAIKVLDHQLSCACFFLSRRIFYFFFFSQYLIIHSFLLNHLDGFS